MAPARAERNPEGNRFQLCADVATTPPRSGHGIRRNTQHKRDVRQREALEQLAGYLDGASTALAASSCESTPGTLNPLTISQSATATSKRPPGIARSNPTSSPKMSSA